MQYQILARKYRPQFFREVLGQDSIVTTLKNALKQARVAHSYLFTGSRGIGKTTLARVFAKALNCKNLDSDFEPCGVCQSCQEIASSSSLDVIEIDGASNRGIDDIRQINETVNYISSTNYRIYIIDEVHMLTKEAFNALLKTLEEPPKHVKFFFATTEPHKVLPTIVSRCQRFDLKRISNELIVEKLSDIALKQKREVEKESLYLLAEFAEGSLRDAESLLDQLFCFEEGFISSTTVRKALGLTNLDAFFKLDNAVKNQDLAFPFDFVEELYNMGKDFAHFVDELINHFRYLLLIKVKKESRSYFYSEELFNRYKLSAEIYSSEECKWILDQLLEQVSIRGAISRVTLETQLLTIVTIKKRVSLESLVDRLNSIGKTLTPEPEKKITSSVDNSRYDTIVRFAAEELEGVVKKEE